jgi:ribosomal protein S18 acetylase RimI-like enzyme
MRSHISFQPHTEMRIRRLGVEDADRLKTVRVAATMESPASVKPTTQEELERSTDEFKKKLVWDSHNYILGAFDGDHLVGIAGLRRERGQKVHHTAILWGIYVIPQYRGQRIATRLVEAVVGIARDIPEVMQIKLCVHTKNVAARRMYMSSGFESYGIERNVIRIGEESFDEELMMMTLR